MVKEGQLSQGRGKGGPRTSSLPPGRTLPLLGPLGRDTDSRTSPFALESASSLSAPRFFASSFSPSFPTPSPARPSGSCARAQAGIWLASVFPRKRRGLLVGARDHDLTGQCLGTAPLPCGGLGARPGPDGTQGQRALSWWGAARCTNAAPPLPTLGGLPVGVLRGEGPPGLGDPALDRPPVTCQVEGGPASCWPPSLSCLSVGPPSTDLSSHCAGQP